MTTTEKATFAAGCFWGIEDAFAQVPGVIATTVGYSGGTTANPTYRDVCHNDTGHAEAVQVEYDPSKVSFDQLLDVFWKIHNPTTRNRQGPDVGSQYRSAIFFHNPDQKARAEASKARLEASGTLRGPIVTEITPAADFYPAEEYHQKYHQKHGGSCRTV
jgi:peptide-methionine (S)-S-oxide reductase